MAKTNPATAAKDPKSLLAKAKSVAGKAPKASAKPARKVLELPPVDSQVLHELIETKPVYEKVKSRFESLNKESVAAALHAYTQEYFDRKSKPANPLIVVGDCDVMFQVQNHFNGLKQYQGAESPEDSIVEALTAGEDGDLARLSEENAVALVKEEVISEPATALRYNLSELIEGHMEEEVDGGKRFVEATDHEKDLGSRLIVFLTTPPGRDGRVTVPGIAEEDRAFLLVEQPELRVRDINGFLDRRIFDYVDNVHQLRRVLRVFNPRIMFTSYNFAVGATEVEKTVRHLAVVHDILGVAAPAAAAAPQE